MDIESLGVIILCPERNSGGLKRTANSIKSEIPRCPCVSVVGNNTTKDDIIDLSKYSRISVGGKTIMSLIDRGMEEIDRDWCLVVVSGGAIRSSILYKYAYFTKSDKDILFPVIDKKYLFYEASINGILLNSGTYKNVGKFGDEEISIQDAKLYWSDRAIERGCKFKAIVGARFV